MNSHLTRVEDAREIMGLHFFGVDNAREYFGKEAMPHEREYLSMVPWSSELLDSVSETHILVAVFPVSIMDLVERAGELFSNDRWYGSKRFAHHRPRLGWRLVRKAAVPGSFMKSWGDQAALLQPDELMPSSQELVYTTIGHCLVTGEKLFQDTMVRALDFGSDHYHVHVGKFAEVLHIEQHWDNPRDPEKSLASQKNPHWA
jgi:hypothetical protein